MFILCIFFATGEAPVALDSLDWARVPFRNSVENDVHVYMFRVEKILYFSYIDIKIQRSNYNINVYM